MCSRATCAVFRGRLSLTYSSRSHAQASSKCVVQERQLKTFLQANEALEADLRKQLSRVAQLERRKQEMEAEQQTVEAYYQVRVFPCI